MFSDAICILSLNGKKPSDAITAPFVSKLLAAAFRLAILAEFILLNYDYDNDEHIDIKEMTFDLVNISGSSELNNKLIRRYIEALDLVSETKINASRMIDDLL